MFCWIVQFTTFLHSIKNPFLKIWYDLGGNQICSTGALFEQIYSSISKSIWERPSWLTCIAQSHSWHTLPPALLGIHPHQDLLASLEGVIDVYCASSGNTPRHRHLIGRARFGIRHTKVTLKVFQFVYFNFHESENDIFFWVDLLKILIAWHPS